MDHVTIDRMHSEINIISLEQCRHVQLLKLMNKISKNDMNLKKKILNTHGNDKVKFKLTTKCSGKYLNSPLHRGSALWDGLKLETQKLSTILEYT